MSLYHYTDAQAVHSILKNQKIWMTDIRFLNDSQELHDGLKILTEQLKTPNPGLFANYDFKDRAINYIRKAFEEHISFGTEEEPVFVFSLSSKKDVLSQWRAYGAYAIEFDRSILKEEVKSLKRCIYESREKKGRATVNVTDAIVAVSQDMAVNKDSLSAVSIDAIIKLVTDAATFKNKGFIEEDESRIILPSNDGEYPNKIQYRVRENMLIPYIELDVSLDCIKSINVGPMKNQDLAYASMKAYAEKVERNWQVDSGNIEYGLLIEKSHIPYRG